MKKKEILNTPEIVDFMIDKSVMVDSKMKLHKRLDELCKLAIKALEQEPCEDCISRQEVIDCFKKWQPYMATRLHEFENELFELPSVNPQKIGWIPVSERLPEKGGDYLVTNVFDIGDKEPVREVNKDYYCYHSKKWLYENENIIAWMPLPEPYKAESEVKNDES